MAVSATTPCIFTDRVPPEIRKQIFDYVLIRQKPITFTHICPVNTDGEQKRKRRWVAYPHHRDAAHPGEYWDEDLSAWLPTQPRVTALLQTCKLFHSEATEAFYGGNSFATDGMRMTSTFLDFIGSSKHAIRTIHLGRYTRNCGEKFWKDGMALPNLRKITVGHSGLCQKNPFRSSPALHIVVRQMTPVLKMLRESYRKQGLPIDPTDVLEILGSKCYYCSCVCQKASPREFCRICPYTIETSAPEHAKLTSGLKALLKKALTDGET